jgi:hypothetical protein
MQGTPTAPNHENYCNKQQKHLLKHTFRETKTNIYKLLKQGEKGEKDRRICIAPHRSITGGAATWIHHRGRPPCRRRGEGGESGWRTPPMQLDLHRPHGSTTGSPVLPWIHHEGRPPCHRRGGGGRSRVEETPRRWICNNSHGSTTGRSALHGSTRGMLGAHGRRQL